jgi:serine/threonine protein kinase
LNNIIHENLLDIKFSFTEERSAFFGVELMEGGSVAEVIAARHSHGLKDLTAIATILRGVLTGIAYLHSNGLFHRHARLTQRCEG